MKKLLKKGKNKAFSKPSNADKSAMEEIGMFSDLGYLHGRGYVPVGIISRDFVKNKRQMIGPGSKNISGNQDGFFWKHLPRIFEGESYTDYIRIGRLERIQAQKNLPAIFYPPEHGKWPSGKGSYYGTFSGPMPYFSRLLKSMPKHSGKSSDRNKKRIYTNPGKKGTGYGYAGLMIDQTIYEHLPEEPARRMSIEHWDKLIGRYPFLLTSPSGKYFWQNPYKEEPIIPPKKLPESKPFTRPPFFPSAPGKLLGGMKDGCFDKFPEHMEDPFKEIILLKPFKDYVNATGQRYLPPAGPKSTRMQSNIGYNVEKKLHKKNYKTTDTIFFKDIRIP